MGVVRIDQNAWWISRNDAEFVIFSERKVKKKPDYSEVRIESFDQFLGENARYPVKKFISLRLYYDMTLACAQ